MCTVLLPPGGNPIAVNKYVNINIDYLKIPEYLQRIILDNIHNGPIIKIS